MNKRKFLRHNKSRRIPKSPFKKVSNVLKKSKLQKGSPIVFSSVTITNPKTGEKKTVWIRQSHSTIPRLRKL